MRSIAICLFTVLLLAGCVGRNASVDQDMAIACSSYNKLGESAVVFYDQMGEAARQAVDSAKAFVGPTCEQWSSGVVIGSRELVDALNQAVAGMLAATEEFEL